MALNALQVKVAKLDAEIARLQDIRAFLVADPGEPEAAPKPKRTRGKNKNKPGLPAQEAGLL